MATISTAMEEVVCPAQTKMIVSKNNPNNLQTLILLQQTTTVSYRQKSKTNFIEVMRSRKNN
jgi:hypothetical protein